MNAWKITKIREPAVKTFIPAYVPVNSGLVNVHVVIKSYKKLKCCRA